MTTPRAAVRAALVSRGITTTAKSDPAITAAVKRGESMTACPRCGGTLGAKLFFNGRQYWQCTSPHPDVIAALESDRQVDNPEAKCGFWSTKTMKADATPAEAEAVTASLKRAGLKRNE